MASTAAKPKKSRYQVAQESRANRESEYKENMRKTKGAMQRVRMRSPLAGKPRAKDGEIVTLPKFEAARFIERGLAEEVD